MSIDYGCGQTNIDRATGIRYGVISQHSISQAWYESSEPDYGEPHCPKCGREIFGIDDNCELSGFERYRNGGCADYACADCDLIFDASDVFPDEPAAFVLDDGRYAAESCLDSDVMLLGSPWYTYAPYCSPCVPGAGNLNDAVATLAELEAGFAEWEWPALGVKTYAFGHSWFDSGVAPYPVLSILTGRPVFPDHWYGSYQDD